MLISLSYFEQGAVIGIDDEDDSTFTITVDQKTFHFQGRYLLHSVADPGFPRGGGANSPGGGGRQHTILPNFPKNCMI